LVGHDRPGIVSQISGALARHMVNVEELDTECVSAPMSGEPLFQAKAKLRLPDGCDIPALRRDLERIAGDLMVDFILEAR
jgi:glycine cleavage system regulatory protein